MRPPPAEQHGSVESAKAAIGNAGDAWITDTSNERATSIYHAEQASATVGVIAELVGSTWTPVCSGTLIDRNTMMTSALCVLDVNTGLIKPAANFRVRFSDGSWSPSGSTYQVSWAKSLGWDFTSEKAVALLTLSEDVAFGVVPNTAPVFGGSIPDLLAGLDESQPLPIVVGFGQTCVNGPNCYGPPTRRMGRIPAPLEIAGTPGYLRIATSPTGWPDNPIAYGIDEGGPLMVKEPGSGRWMVLGVTHTDGTWTFVGNSEDPNDIFSNRWQHFLSFLGTADEDGDMIPDVMDNCRPSVCQSAGVPIEECFNPLQEDFLKRGVGDACCFANEHFVRNSNAAVEGELQAVARPDACDPVPLLTFGADLPAPDTDELASVLRVRTHSPVGSGAMPRQFTQDAAFRYCSCYDDQGVELSELDCRNLSLCRAEDVVVGHNTFTPVDVNARDHNQYDHQILGSTGSGNGWLWFDRLGWPVEIEWSWRDAMIAGTITGKYSPNVYPPYNRSITGLFASAVLKREQFYSTRDEDFDGDLRAALKYVDTPDLGPGIYPGRPFSGSPGFGNYPPLLPPLEPWVDLYPRVTPVPLLVEIDPNNDMPFGHLRWEDPLVYSFADQLTDHTPWAYPDAATAWLWIPPVEPVAYLQKKQIAARAAYLAPSGVQADRVALVLSQGNGMQVLWDGVGGQNVAAAAGNDDPNGDLEKEQVRMPLGGRALYSASRNEVLLVGGSNLQPEDRIRRYDIALAQIDVAAFDPAFAPTANVLGATFDHVDNLLYVLDTDGANARLIEHDLDAAEAKVLWETSDNGLYTSTYLGITENGRLVLIVTDSATTTAWTIDIRGGKATFDGRLDIEAPPAAIPAMGTYALSVPVLDDAGVDYVELVPRRFMEGEPCSGL